jgi:hypothetical protein
LLRELGIGHRDERAILATDARRSHDDVELRSVAGLADLVGE